jgi:SAM-dependent methyltransferase
LTDRDERINAFTASYAGSHAAAHEASTTRAGYFYQRRLSVVSEELNRLPPSGRLLDVGCGAGHYSRPTLARGWAYTGLDMSPEMVEAARRSHEGPDFEVGSVTALRFASDSFDAVLALGALGYIAADERQQAWDEIGQVLRPGGTLIASLLNPRAPIWMIRTATERSRRALKSALAKEPGYRSPEHLYGAGEIEDHLDRAGFRLRRSTTFALAGVPDRWFGRAPELLARRSLWLEQAQRWSTKHLGMARLVVAEKGE